jgi:hypothetical protein
MFSSAHRFAATGLIPRERSHTSPVAQQQYGVVEMHRARNTGDLFSVASAGCARRTFPSEHSLPLVSLPRTASVVASLRVGCIACLLYRPAALACFIALQPYGHLLFSLFRAHLQALRAASCCVAFPLSWQPACRSPLHHTTPHAARRVSGRSEAVSSKYSSADGRRRARIWPHR